MIKIHYFHNVFIGSSSTVRCVAQNISCSNDFGKTLNSSSSYECETRSCKSRSPDEESIYRSAVPDFCANQSYVPQFALWGFRTSTFCNYRCFRGNFRILNLDFGDFREIYAKNKNLEILAMKLNVKNEFVVHYALFPT